MGWMSLYDIANTVVTGVGAAVNASNHPLPAGARVGVVNGEIAWDQCEKCGQLAISETQLYYSEAFPVPANTVPQGNCASPLLCADYSLQLIRCAPTVDSTGKAPSMALLAASAREILSDAPLIMSTAACTLAALVDANSIMDYVVKAVTAVGPAGACVGNQLDFTVAVGR